MIVQQKIGNLNSFDTGGRQVDVLSLEWFETNKRIMHKRTTGGREVVIRFLEGNPGFRQDDVLFENDQFLVVVDVPACEAIVLKPSSMREMAALCYEIGNKHLPLFLQGEDLVVPFEAPLFRLLTAAGFAPARENRKLFDSLATSVKPHGNTARSDSLFNRILKLTTPASNGQ